MLAIFVIVGTISSPNPYYSDTTTVYDINANGSNYNAIQLMFGDSYLEPIHDTLQVCQSKDCRCKCVC